MKNKTLKLNNVSKEYIQSNLRTSIFKNISYSFENNRSYAIMGPSGVGKSTLLHLLAGIEKVDRGQIEINDQVISQDDFEQRIALLHSHIGLVFQQPCLINELSVLENVILNSLANNRFDQANYEHGKELLNSIGLLEKTDSSVTSLSGGQQQRIAILRALFHKPSFILADEPTGSLDKNSADQIMKLLLNYKKKYAMGLIISTHDIYIAKQCDIILKIENQNLITTSNFI